jgi:hypothetical protein
VSQDRPENAMTMLLRCSIPNSTLSDTNSSLNYKVLAHNHSVHGDGANRGQFRVFQVIYPGVLKQEQGGCERTWRELATVSSLTAEF